MLAFEEDKAIFDALIAPAMRTPVVTEAEPQYPIVSSIDLDDEDIPIQHVFFVLRGVCLENTRSV